MPTSTTLSTLNINKLTRAQYDTAVQGGVIGPTDLSIITDENFDAVPQFTTLPTASADNVGEVVQYIGASDATYTHNYFYECIEDSGTYSWNQTNVQPDYNTNDYTALLNKPSINNVVLSGNKTAADLSLLTDVTQGSNISIDKTNPANPVISATGQVNSDWNSNSGLSQILNKPSLSTVATTGSYNDLSNKPTIPAAQVNSDWNSNSGVSQILNKPTLATVATSGNYSDLSGTPTIPTVNNPTITITQGGVTKGSFTLNQASGDTIALDAGGGSSLPSQTGHDGEFLTTDGTDASWTALSTVAVSGAYSDLTGTPTIPCIVVDYVVADTTGIITVETNKEPTTKTVKEVIGGATIAGTWTTVDTTHYTFTPTTASDILSNANGFLIKVA